MSSPERILISVIVPYHNAERTIQRTLQSLSAQTMKEGVEYLLVNDGSTDRSEEIAELYLRLDPLMASRTVMTAHQFRRGSAAAYRTGVEKSRGEFLGRCDADDAMAPDALSKLLQAAGPETDISAAPLCEVWTTGKKHLRCSHATKGLNAMRPDTAGFSLCNKLIRRSLIVDNDLLPTEGIDFWDDLSVTCRAIALARHIAAVSDPVYYYYRDPEAPSMTMGHKEAVVRDRMVYALLMEKWFVDRGLSQRYGIFLDTMKFAAKIKLLQRPRADVALWKETFPEVNRHIWRLAGIHPLIRLCAWIAAKLPSGWVQGILDWEPCIIDD